MYRPKNYLFIAFFLIGFAARSQDNASYQAPPKDIMDLVLAKPTPAVSIDKKAEWMLLMDRSDYPTIEELAQPELRIAGLRMNPNNFSPSRSSSFSNLQLKNIKTGKLMDIDGLPKDARIMNVQWSPDQNRVAFIHSGNTAVDLYVFDLADRKARKVNINPLNTVLGGSFQWSGNNSLIYKTIVPGKKLSAQPSAPSGPVSQENIGKAAASRTYQDLIRNAYDEALFEYYGTAQLVKNDLSNETPIGTPALYRSINLSPDKNFILATTIDKPFSYLVSTGGFPHTVAVMDLNGKVVKQLAKNPSSEGQPIGFDDASTFARGFNWRDDEPCYLCAGIG